MLSLLLLSACGKIEEQPNNNPLIETDSRVKDSSPSKVSHYKGQLYKTFEELTTTNDEHMLEIRKEGHDKAYKASELLEYVILDMLQKSEKLDNTSTEYSGFNYNKYDYSLQFAGANEILLSIEDDAFFMKEDENIYKIWGDSSNFWKSLLIDEMQFSIDLPKILQDSMRKVYRHDADGDGTEEEVVLGFYKSLTKDSNGQLKLKVGLSEVTVEKEIGWVSEPFHIMLDTPAVEFIPKNKGSAVVVSYSWMTNGVGMTGEIRAYEYEGKELKELKVDLPDMNFSYLKNGKVKINFSQLNRQITVNPAVGEVRSLEEESGFDVSRVLEDKLGFYPHILQYIKKDFDGDGKIDLCSKSLIRFQVPPRMNLGSLYTIYKYDNGKIVPKSVALLPPFDEKNKMTLMKSDVVETVFNLGFLDFERAGDKELWSNMENQYGKSDFETAVTELFEEGYIKKQNNRIFINSSGFPDKTS
jgi:hypothetical protein